MTIKEKDIDVEFREAYEKANSTTKKFPVDVMLLFYAYYKQATEQAGIYSSPDGESDLISAFKLNALLQVQGLSATEAKIKYIELVNKEIG